jgi:hypothetical protein
MTDRGSFKVQSEALRRAATMWSKAATDMGSANEKIGPGVGMGSYFGVLAGSSGVSGNYDQWSTEMAAAITKAQSNFQYLDAALNSVANDYDGVDATVATDMDTLDRKIEG